MSEQAATVDNPPQTSDQLRNVLLNEFGLPENLAGKRVLELFSGSKSVSMEGWVTERGGDYVSVDNLRMRSADVGAQHMLASAWHLPLPPETADYVLMNGPTILELKNRSWIERYITHKQNVTATVFPLLQESLRVLKRNSGCMVGVAVGLSEADVSYIRKGLRAIIPDINSQFDLSFPLTSVPDADDRGVLIPGKYTRSLKIIRK